MALLDSLISNKGQNTANWEPVNAQYKLMYAALQNYYKISCSGGWISVALMGSSKEEWVTLNEPVPVFISYFTSWTGEDGLLNFREDIYGRDKTMAENLFGN